MKRILSVVTLALGMTFLGAAAAQAYTDITPAEARAWAASDTNVYILDVRTEAEWRWVGHPGKNKLGDGDDLVGKVVNIAYMIDTKGGFAVNPSFVSDVAEVFASNPDVVLITMCRSGQRSIAAALALEAVGFANAYNMVTGFEGGSDSLGYRTKNGWKVDGLPYTTSGAGYQD